MSRTVEFADVRRRIAEFGERAMVITVTADDKPHVVTAVVQVDGDHLVTRVGARTAANLAERPDLTLTWAPPPGGDYVLILDGTAASAGAASSDGVTEISIEIDRGILHRLAELPASGPSCIAL